MFLNFVHKVMYEDRNYTKTEYDYFFTQTRIEVSKLDSSERGESGFGSTGK